MIFTPASLSYLAQFILSVLVAIYLVIRLVRSRTRQPAHLVLFTGFILSVTGLSFLFFLESALPPSVRLFALYAQNMVLGVGLACLLQFAYHFPTIMPRSWEMRVTLILSGAYTLYETGYAAYRYGLLLAHGHVIFRPDWADFPLALGLLWVPMVLVRQSVRTSALADPHDPRRFLHHMRHPRGAGAEAARALAVIYLLPVGLVAITILKAFYFVPPSVYQLSLSIGVMIALAALIVAYLNFLPETTSFITKLAGVMLVSLLVVLGSIGWVLAPKYADLYQPVQPADRQAFRFTPNQQGGYDIVADSLEFETDYGQPLNLVDVIHQAGDQTVTSLDFEFPFYGRTYHEIYVTNDSPIAMGRPIAYADYQYRYGDQVPMIYPLLLDLAPGEGAGGVFARYAPDRLILTWEQVPAFYHSTDNYTFQVSLYRTGVFELVYWDVPDQHTYHADDAALANLWLIGITPGSPTTAPQALDLGLLNAGQVVASDSQGIVQDYYLGLRYHLNDLLLPVFWLMVLVSSMTVVGFPWLLYRSLLRPLNRLLTGLQRLEAADYAVSVPVQAHDELGFLTQSFNLLAARLHDLIHNLSDKVAERTAELSQARALAEQQRQAAETANVQLTAHNEELDAFAYTVAHDIRQPVAEIVNYADLFNGSADQFYTSSQQQAVRALSITSHRLTRIIDELLLLAGLRQTEVQIEPLNMAAIVREVLGRLRNTIQQSGAEITLSGVDDWPLALGYRGWIEEVWVNYLDNACAYGRLGDLPPRIAIGAAPLELDDAGQPASIRFWVRDAGPGLSVAEQAQLFAPFSRLDQVRTRGHGLGLSIVRRIVTKLGGTATVESDGIAGHGSTFIFTLPAAPIGTPRPPVIERVATIGAADDLAVLRGLRVLIADDEKLYADSVRSLTTTLGMAVVGVAYSGQDALAMARTLRPQIMLMDIDMPVINGLVVTRAVTLDQPDIKIVMLTASEREADVFEAIRSGAAGYLLKGITAKDFKSQLTSLMQGEAPLPSGLANRVLAEFARSHPSDATEEMRPLTSQQLDILQRVACGLTYREVGEALFLTEKTIKYHMGQIVERLHVKNRSQAVAYYQRYLKSRPSDKD